VPARPPDAPLASEARSVQRAPFQYAVVRVVPKVDRGEGFNAGVIVFCRPLRFLGARVHLDTELLARFAPGCDPDVVRAHLELIPRLCRADPTAGPLSALSQPERFHWLVSPSSTVVQPAEVHTGMTADPSGTLDHLFRSLVERPAPGT
jgi:hypothetical protein